MFVVVSEGVLTKWVGKKPTERYVFLFDGLIVLTKQNLKRSSVTGPVGDYKLKVGFHSNSRFYYLAI